MVSSASLEHTRTYAACTYAARSAVTPEYVPWPHTSTCWVAVLAGLPFSQLSLCHAPTPPPHQTVDASGGSAGGVGGDGGVGGCDGGAGGGDGLGGGNSGGGNGGGSDGGGGSGGECCGGESGGGGADGGGDSGGAVGGEGG